jgi:hypothetical protein
LSFLSFSLHAFILSNLDYYHITNNQNSDTNIVEGLDHEGYLLFRRIILSAVLSPDMKDHFVHTEVFKNRIKKNNIDCTLPQDRELIISTALKVCDVGHCMKVTTVHYKWRYVRYTIGVVV